MNQVKETQKNKFFLLFVVYWICVCTMLQVSFPYLEIA